MRARFGDFVFDSERRELQRSGAVVKVTPKVFRLLEVLLAMRPKAVAKRDLHDFIWPDTFVLEANLKGLVRDLRRALGDDEKDQRWVKTIYGFGYAFASDDVEVHDEEPSESRHVFVLEIGKRRVRLRDGESVIGRDPESTVPLSDADVSRRHARITIHHAAAFIEDLGSKNGTFVGSVRLDGVTPLHDRDVIRVGSDEFVFRILERQPTTITAAR